MTSKATDRAREVIKVLAEAKRVAKRYYALTGRPLGITGEIAEYEAIRLLGLKPAPVRQPGYDAIGPGAKAKRLQIKGRSFVGEPKPHARVGAIKLKHSWDAVLLVLLNADFEATAIYKAGPAAVKRALTRPGSRARNERGQMSISQFKAIGRKVWPRTERQ